MDLRYGLENASVVYELGHTFPMNTLDEHYVSLIHAQTHTEHTRRRFMKHTPADRCYTHSCADGGIFEPNITDGVICFTCDVRLVRPAPHTCHSTNQLFRTYLYISTLLTSYDDAVLSDDRGQVRVALTHHKLKLHQVGSPPLD